MCFVKLAEVFTKGFCNWKALKDESKGIAKREITL